jgi:hypothetical protein
MRSFFAEISAWALPICLAGLLASLSAFLTFANVTYSDGEAVLAVFPPWWSDAQAFNAATASDLRVVGFGPMDFLLIVGPASEGQLGELRAAGAALVLNAAAPQLCRWTGMRESDI